MANNYRIAVIGCDGTGPEVVREGLKVISAASRKFGFKYETKDFDFTSQVSADRKTRR